jgi:hypothetical protein
MFSVREQSAAYEKARQMAWDAIQQKLEVIKKKLKIDKVQLEKLVYDQDSYVSEIEELPDDPKAAQPNEVQIRVGLEALYRILQ